MVVPHQPRATGMVAGGTPEEVPVNATEAVRAQIESRCATRCRGLLSAWCDEWGRFPELASVCSADEILPLPVTRGSSIARCVIGKPESGCRWRSCYNTLCGLRQSPTPMVVSRRHAADGRWTRAGSQAMGGLSRHSSAPVGALI